MVLKKSDYDDETIQLPNPSINHLSESLSDLRNSEKGYDANSTEEILVNKMNFTEVNHRIFNAKEK